ncbi:MAG TPA: transposase [Candidatus Acidoferrales bacterium]|nr:transposase [Candidatus Acidoferrales bacterium]
MPDFTTLYRFLRRWVIVADLDQRFVLSQIARRGPWNDCANLPAVVQAASQQTRIGLGLADAEFDSERNHTYIRQQLGAQRVIPAKSGKKTWRIRGVRAEMRRAFPPRLYRRRTLIESLFSSVKRKLSARAPGRSLCTQKRQALLLGLSFNLYRLRRRYLFWMMSTELSTDNAATTQTDTTSRSILDGRTSQCPRAARCVPVHLLPPA